MGAKPKKPTIRAENSGLAHYRHTNANRSRTGTHDTLHKLPIVLEKNGAPGWRSLEPQCGKWQPESGLPLFCLLKTMGGGFSSGNLGDTKSLTRRTHLSSRPPFALSESTSTPGSRSRCRNLTGMAAAPPHYYRRAKDGPACCGTPIPPQCISNFNPTINPRISGELHSLHTDHSAGAPCLRGPSEMPAWKSGERYPSPARRR